MNKVVIIAVFVVIVLAGGFLLSQQSTKPIPSLQPQFQQNQHGEPASQRQMGRHEQDAQESGGYGFRKAFYRKDGISLQHYWPGEESFSPEETEILILNESSSNVEVKAYDLEYSVEGKVYPHKSGTWEKFPTTTSWDRIEYINIKKPYYQGQPLGLTTGQKGKLHWHIQFGPSSLDGSQTVKVQLILLKDGKTIPIHEELTRSSGTVVSREDH